MISAHFIKQWSDSDFDLDVQLDVLAGDFVCLFGESGSGKTTLLRMLAGLSKADDGFVRTNESVWFDSDKKINQASHKRNVGMVFQQNSLFPNMTVLENILFAANVKVRNEELDELIEIAEIAELLDRQPESLSGGQKQRVDLVRTLARKPKLLLLDEPLSALDPEMRSKLQSLILTLHQRYGLTTIMVSHDLPEIFRMANVVVEMQHGRITRKGSASEVFGFNRISGKFQLMGHIASIEQQDVVHIVSVLVAREMVRVVVNRDEAQNLAVGDRVLVAAKAFSPMIQKLD